MAMLSLGRRQKPLVLGAAIILLVLLVSVSFSSTKNASISPIVGSSNSGSTSGSDSVHKAEFGVGEAVSPSNDDTLLSGATIEQDTVNQNVKAKPHVVGNEKVDTIAGSDASLKSKEESIAKAKGSKEIESYSGSSESDGDTPLKDTKIPAKKPVKDTTKDTTAKPLTDKSAASGSGNSGYEYVVMIDAGSTGSRVHVYSFDTSVSPPALMNEEFKMLKPGLSSFDIDTVGAAKSLDPLLELALASIPTDKQGCSPVAVKATAGLRLLGKAKSDAILKQVRKHLEEDYPFPVVDGDGISIMDGSDEGVYAWITTNYLLGNIGTSKKLDTAAVFDLGGGSTQIVFEPTDGDSLLEGEHKYNIEFGGRKFTLYQYSHLGYGLMQARNKVNAEVLKSEMKTAGKSKFVPLKESQIKNAVADVTIENPCVPPGVTAEDVIVELENGDKYAVTFVPPKKTSSDSLAGQCKFLTDSILNKDLDCESDSCSFNGVYQPSFKDQFPSTADMYVFSYFYDRLQPIGMPDSFTLKEMNDIMESVCAGSHLWDKYFTQEAHIKELENEPLWCLDLNFMTSLLHNGYDIPLKRELKTAKTIGGNELGWCLGASLPLLDKSNWTCRVTKEL